MWYYLTDLIIPIFTSGLGALTKHRPPQLGRSILYRSKRSQRSQKTWDYTNRRLGEYWFKTGIVLVVVVLLDRVFSSLEPFYTSAINIAGALACLIAAFPIVERELKKNFDAEGQDISGSG